MKIGKTAAALALTGGASLLISCRDLSSDAADSVAARVGSHQGIEIGLEVEALDSFLAGSGIIALVLVIATLTVAAISTRWFSIWLQRRGLDPEGRATRIITLGLIAFTGLIGYGVFLRLVRLAPVLTTLMLLVVTTIVLFGNLASIQNLISGAGIALRGTITPGLHVRIGEAEGRIERTGPLTVWLRTAGGALIMVPNRLFTQDSFSIRQASRTAQVSLRYHWPHPLRPSDFLAAKSLVLLCPYHQADLDVATEQTEDDKAMAITFHTSTEPLAGLAMAWMYDALDEHVSQFSIKIDR